MNASARQNSGRMALLEKIVDFRNEVVSMSPEEVQQVMTVEQMELLSCEFGSTAQILLNKAQLLRFAEILTEQKKPC